MSGKLSFFLLGLVCGIALTTLHKPHSQSKQLSKGLDHGSEIPETAAPIPPFGAAPSSVRPMVEVITPGLSQKDILTKIANFKTAEQIIFETNEPARRLFNEHRN